MDKQLKFRGKIVFDALSIISSLLVIYSSVNLVLFNVFLSSAPTTHPQLGWIPIMLSLMTILLISACPILILKMIHYFLIKGRSQNYVFSQDSKKVIGIRYNIMLKILLALSIICSLFFLADIFQILIYLNLIDLNLVEIGDQIFRFINSYLFFLIGTYLVFLIMYGINKVKKSTEFDFQSPIMDFYNFKYKLIATLFIYLGIILIYIFSIGTYGYISSLLRLPFTIPEFYLINAEEARNVMFFLFIGLGLLTIGILFLKFLKDSLKENKNLEIIRVEKKKWLLILGYILIGVGGLFSVIGGLSNIMMLLYLIVSPVVVVGPDITNLITHYFTVLSPVIGFITGIFILIPWTRYKETKK